MDLYRNIHEEKKIKNAFSEVNTKIRYGKTRVLLCFICFS